MKRLSIGLVDQFVSSLTNFLGVVAAARLLDSSPSDLGRFGVASAIILAAINLNRTAIAEPLSTHLSTPESSSSSSPWPPPSATSVIPTGSAWPAPNGGLRDPAVPSGPGSSPRPRTRCVPLQDALSSTLVVSLVVAIAIAVPAAVGVDLLGRGSLLAALFVPAVLLQDTLRYAFSALGKMKLVLIADVLWLAWVVAAAVLVRSAVGPGGALAMWLGGIIPALAVMMLHPLVSSPTLSVSYLRDNRAYIGPVVAGWGFVVLSGNLLPLVIGLFGELELAGRYRLLQAVFGPVGVLVQASSLIGLPILARSAARGRRALVNATVGIGLGLATAAIVWAAILLALPERLGVDLVGETWPAVRAALPYMVIFFVLQTIGYCSIWLLQTLRDGRAVFAVRSLLGLGLLAGALGGLFVGHTASAILVGMAAAAAAASVLWVGACRRALRYFDGTAPVAP